MARILVRYALVLVWVGTVIIFTTSWQFEDSFILSAAVFAVVWVVSGVALQPRTWWRP